MFWDLFIFIGPFIHAGSISRRLIEGQEVDKQRQRPMKGLPSLAPAELNVCLDIASRSYRSSYSRPVGLLISCTVATA